MINVEQAIGDFRTIGKKGVIVRLLEYSYRLAINSNSLRPTVGGFMVLNYHSTRKTGKEGLIEAVKKAQTVTSDFIQRMVYDSNNGHILFNYSLSSSKDVNISMKVNEGDIGYSGFLCTYHTKPTWRSCFEEDPETPAWADGGLTPHEL